MPFGQHEGERMADIPDSYLLWLRKQDGIRWSAPRVWAYLLLRKDELDELVKDPWK